MKTWSCKVGEVEEEKVPHLGDGPMREAVAERYRELTGEDPAFVFSGWGHGLEEKERAVVEDRDPDLEVQREECRKQARLLGLALAGAYPHVDGDMVVLGPGVFSDPAGDLVSVNGENYVRQSAGDRLALSPRAVKALLAAVQGDAFEVDDLDPAVAVLEAARGALRTFEEEGREAAALAQLAERLSVGEREFLWIRMPYATPQQVIRHLVEWVERHRFHALITAPDTKIEALPLGLVTRLEEFAEANDADVVITRSVPTNSELAEWAVGITWGKEAEDSPMAGAQALGCDSTLEKALGQALEECRA